MPFETVRPSTTTMFALLVLLMLPACGGGPDTASSPAKPDPSACVPVSAPRQVPLAAAESSLAELAGENGRAWPFVQPPIATLRESKKKVFAHYFVPFPISIDNLDPKTDYYTVNYLSPSGENNKFIGSGGFIKQRPLPRPIISKPNWDTVDTSQDVRRASALGIDGFAVDLMCTSGPIWNAALRLLDSAAAADPGFKILLMPDMEAEFKAQPDRVLSTVRTLAKYPAAWRLDDGRLVLAPYNAQNQGVEWWKNLIAELKAEGIDIAFLPVFQNWGKFAPSYAPICYGMSDWGERNPAANSGWKTVAEKVHAMNAKWMAPASPQDMRPKDLLYIEAANSENYRVMWENAILGGADLVHVITWNDYSESTEISPSSGIQWSFYDLTAYYTAWFKTGTIPVVTQDTLYYFHRIQATSATPDPGKQAHPYHLASAAAANDIELLAFAAAPATLQIDIGGKTYSQDVGAGMSSFKVPLAEGTPTFKMIRNGNTVAAVQSGYAISNTITYQDLLYRSGSSRRDLVAPR